MTFVVEDGTGLTTANAYVTTAFVDSYASDRGLTAWTGTATEKEQKIVLATQYVDVRFGSRFANKKNTTTQALEFPRNSETTLPVKLQQAIAEYAIRATTPLMPDPSSSGRTAIEETKELGPLKKSFKYQITGSTITRSIPLADSMIRTLLIGGGIISGAYR